MAWEWVEALDTLPLALLAGVAFLAAFLETLPALGLVVPGQSTIVAAALLAGRRSEGLLPLVVAVALGAVAGDLLGYAIGHRVGLRFLGRLPRRLRPAPHRLRWLEHLFAHHGMKTVLMARFQPLTRCFAPALAGASRMPLGRFAAASVAGALMAATLLVGGGFAAGLGFEMVGKVAGGAVAALGLAAVVALVLFILARRRKRVEDRMVAHVRPARWPEDGPGVRALLDAYFREFAAELGRQDFAGELGGLETQYGPPSLMLVAEAEGELAGCVGLRPMGGGLGEVKRMVVDPTWRGAGIGTHLGQAVVEAARAHGMHRLVLDTTPGMTAARELYAHLGFQECPAYYRSPLPQPVYMERVLLAEPATAAA